jgi:hypothetical protein
LYHFVADPLSHDQVNICEISSYTLPSAERGDAGKSSAALGTAHVGPIKDPSRSVPRGGIAMVMGSGSQQLVG